MNRWRFAGFIFMLANVPAHSLEITDLRTPKRAELNRIERRLTRVNAAINAIKDAEDQIKSLTKKHTAASVEGKIERARDLEEQIAAQEKLAKEALVTKTKESDAAIASAIATALEPRAWPAGITHNPLYPKSQTRWRIVARENERLPWIDKDGNPIVFPPAKPNRRGRLPMAQTLPNQVSVIHAQAFASAEELILTVVHEMNHYELSKDPTYPTKVSAEDEVKCYELELQYLEHLPWGDRPEDKTRKDQYRILLDEAKKEKEADRDLAKVNKVKPGLPEFEAAPPGLDVDLTPIIERSNAIEKAARQHEEARYLGYIWAFAKRVCSEQPPYPAEYGMVVLHPDRSIYRLKANKLHRDGFDYSDCTTRTYVGFLVDLGAGQRELFPPHRAPTAAPPEPSYPRPTAPRVPEPPNVSAPKPRVPVGGEDDLRDLVIRACKDPASLKGSPLPDLSWFPAPGYGFRSGLSDGMDSCQIQLWHYLLDRNENGRALDLDDVTQRAWGYQYRPQPSAPPCTPRGIWSKECYRN